MGVVGGFSPTVSPDGRFMAVSRLDGKNNIWLLEIARGVITPFTADPVGAQTPLWSPDGRYVVFSSARTGIVELYKRLVTGGRDDEPVLLNYPNNKVATDWSSDGEFLLYRSNDPKTSYDIWALPMRTQDPTPIEVVRTEFGERDAQFSPDAKWIAYESNRSGRSEIYVRPFRHPGPEQQISVNGGAQVRWNRDGKELFYIALDGRLMTVPVRLDPDGQTIEARAPVRLFMTRMGDPVQTTHKQQYVVSPDGQQFLMSTVLDEGDSLISVILNWHPERGK
jgi:Tol biopolymer transport system component